MLKRMINSAMITFTISPVDPLLIKSGQATVGGVDMSFVRTRRFDGRDEPFIPGSSLKGVIRSYAEKICRSLKAEPFPVCLPYVDPGKMGEGQERQASCGLRFEKYKKEFGINDLPTIDAYRLSCPACRIFGSNVFTGRLKTADAYLQKGSIPAFEVRDGVAIDRMTGGAAPGAKYDLEVLVKGDFTTSIEIHNFERWQLGLLALVLRDMEQELVRIGTGTSRGLGRIKADITSFNINYYGRQVSTLAGLAVHCTDKEKADYGFFPETAASAKLPAPAVQGLRQIHDITSNWKDVLAPAVDDFAAYMNQVQWPIPIEDYMRRR